MEVWKDIPGYERLYQASDKGRIRSSPSKTTQTTLHGERKWQVRILKEKNTKGREMRVDLWKDGKPTTFLVHRLVAATFIPKPKGKDCINHKDGNPRNNDIKNLEWCTHEENNNHAFDTGLMSSNIRTILILENGVKKEFRSMAKASEYLGFASGAISNASKRGQRDIGGTKFKVLGGLNEQMEDNTSGG